MIELNGRLLPLRECLQLMIGQGRLFVMVTDGSKLCWRLRSNGGLLRIAWVDRCFCQGVIGDECDIALGRSRRVRSVVKVGVC